MNSYAALLRARFFDATRAEEDHAGPRVTAQRSEHGSVRVQTTAVYPIARHWVPGLDLYGPRNRAA
jgi:hypothetical protein